MKIARMMFAALVAVSFLFAADKAPAAPAKAGKAVKKDALKTCNGTVVSVDAVANTIIVKTKKVEDTIHVEAGAKILSNKKEIALGDIKADVSVTVKYKVVDGKKIAATITEKPAPAGKGKKAAASTEAPAPEAAPASDAAPAPESAPTPEPAPAPAPAE
jgi:hypothetical protein